MTSHCAGAVQMREKSERGIRKWEEMWFKRTSEDRERGGQQWCAMEDCSTDERLCPETHCRRQWTDEYVERPDKTYQLKHWGINRPTDSAYYEIYAVSVIPLLRLVLHYVIMSLCSSDSGGSFHTANITNTNESVCGCFIEMADYQRTELYRLCTPVSSAC